MSLQLSSEVSFGQISFGEKKRKKKAPLAGIVHVNPKLSTIQAFPGVAR